MKCKDLLRKIVETIRQDVREYVEIAGDGSHPTLLASCGDGTTWTDAGNEYYYLDGGLMTGNAEVRSFILSLTAHAQLGNNDIGKTSTITVTFKAIQQDGVTQDIGSGGWVSSDGEHTKIESTQIEIYSGGATIAEP